MPILQLKPDQPFSLDLTLSCGQVFRWEKLPDGWWTGIVGDRVIRIRQDGDILHYEGARRQFIDHYFSLDLNLPSITSSFDRDPLIHAAIGRCFGLRLVRQPPWECLISYICATNSNIPMIRKRIERIAQTFGKRIEVAGRVRHGFPDPSDLAGSCDAVLSECRMGYRGPYVQKTACRIADRSSWENEIASLGYEDARETLMGFRGIGQKAADCILLFAFQKYEAFPVDVWIRRIMRDNYLPFLRKDGTMTSREYTAIRSFAREHFGDYCGYAQEYLYGAREYGKKGINVPSSGLSGGQPRSCR